MAITQVSRRYAQAWLGSAKDKNAMKAAAADCDSLLAMVKNSPDLVAFLTSPLISQAEQTKVVDAIVAKAGLDAITKSFLLVLVANRRLAALPGALEAAREMLDAEAGEVKAIVTSATKLDDKKVIDISSQISKKLGKDVQVETHIDPSLIGGLVIRVGSRMIDDSVKTKLERLQRRLQTGSAA